MNWYRLPLAVLILLLAGSQLPAVPILQEDFSTVPGRFDIPPGSTVGIFTVVAGQGNLAGNGVDVMVGSGPPFYGDLCVSPTSAPCLDINALNPGALRTTSSYLLSSGTVYRITITLHGYGQFFPNDVRIQFGPLSEDVPVGIGQTVQYLREFNGDGLSHFLYLTSLAPAGSRGSLIDNIMVEPVQREEEVPEPSTWLGVGSALLLAGAMRRRSG